MVVRQSETEPPFMLAVSPSSGDVSQEFVATGLFAPSETKLFRHILRRRCNSASSTFTSSQLVVDVGANLGYFTSFALSMGCSVIAFEPQPQLASYLVSSLALNGHSARVRVHPVIVSDERATVNMTVEQDWGLSHVATMPGLKKKGLGPPSHISVTSAPLDELVPSQAEVVLLKIDTEGFEGHVLRSAEQLLQSGRVENIIVEMKDWVEREWKLEWLKNMSAVYHIMTYREQYFKHKPGTYVHWSVTSFPMERWSFGRWPKWQDLWLRKKSLPDP